MINYIDKMVARRIRENGEYYMDLVPNLLLEDNRDVQIFEVEKYIGWGTPQDYDDYMKWERYFYAKR